MLKDNILLKDKDIKSSHLIPQDQLEEIISATLKISLANYEPTGLKAFADATRDFQDCIIRTEPSVKFITVVLQLLQNWIYFPSRIHIDRIKDKLVFNRLSGIIINLYKFYNVSELPIDIQVQLNKIRNYLHGICIEKIKDCVNDKECDSFSIKNQLLLLNYYDRMFKKFAEEAQQSSQVVAEA